MSAVVDFRSDTVTRPTAGMLEAMVSAELGDDVLDGDGTRIPLPAPLVAALALCIIGTLVWGVVPETVTHFTEVSLLAAGP